MGVKLGALIVGEEVLALDAITFGQAKQATFEADQPFVDVVKLLDQRIDARLVKRQRFDVGDDLFPGASCIVAPEPVTAARS